MNARSSQVRSGLGQSMPYTGNGTSIPIFSKGMGLPAPFFKGCSKHVLYFHKNKP